MHISVVSLAQYFGGVRCSSGGETGNPIRREVGSPWVALCAIAPVLLGVL